MLGRLQNSNAPRLSPPRETTHGEPSRLLGQSAGYGRSSGSRSLGEHPNRHGQAVTRKPSRPRWRCLRRAWRTSRTCVFLLFGDHCDPRLLPVATMHPGPGRPGLARRARLAGVRPPVFPPGHAAHALPRRPARRRGDDPPRHVGRTGSALQAPALPLAEAARGAAPRPSEARARSMLERIATSDPLAGPCASAAPSRRAAIDTARAIAARVAQPRGADEQRTRGARPRRVTPSRTGVPRARPTLVASYMERGGGIQGHPRHLFILADSTARAATPRPSSTRRAIRCRSSGVSSTTPTSPATASTSWCSRGGRTAATASCSSCTSSNGEWREMARGETSWCADRTKRGDAEAHDAARRGRRHSTPMSHACWRSFLE